MADDLARHKEEEGVRLGAHLEDVLAVLELTRLHRVSKARELVRLELLQDGHRC